MPDPRAQRTLVKSPPELWAEISDVATLARHLGEFGEIRITRTEPETTVVWEGDRARGTVELEPAGWGTKVTLTAQVVEPEPVAEAPEVDASPTPEPAPAAEVSPEPEPAPTADTSPGPEPQPAPVADASPEPEPEAEPLAVTPTAPPEPAAAGPTKRPSFFGRLFGRRRAKTPITEPQAAAEGAPEPEPVAAPEPAPEPVAVAPEPVAVAPEPALEPVAAEPERGPAPEPEPEPLPEPAAAEPAVPVLDAERAEAVLVGVLDDLGAAHHRPFSRG